MHLPYWFLFRPCIWQRTMVEIGTSLWKMLKKFTGVILMLVNAVTQEEQSMQLKGVRKTPYYTRVSECPFVRIFWIQLRFWKINMSAGIYYFYIIPCESGLLPGIWHKVFSQCRAYTRALQSEKSISPLFPSPRGAVVANDWSLQYRNL